MKLTKSKLQKIIKEELQKILKESDWVRIGSFPGNEETLDAMHQYLIDKDIYEPMHHKPKRVNVFTGITETAGKELLRAVEEDPEVSWTRDQAEWLWKDLNNQVD